MTPDLNIGFRDAQIAAEAALAAAQQNNRPIAVAVTDSRGDIVYFTRQDGTKPIDVRNAERKAYTAAFIGRDTSQYRLQIMHDGRTVADWADPNITTLHGGWTLRRNSQVIGGIGVAGSSDEDKDEQIALKGAEAAAQLSVDVWRKQRDPRIIRDR